MVIAAIHWNPPAKTLRQFGVVSIIGFALIAWAFSGHPISFKSVGPWIPTLVGLGLGLVTAGVGLVYPPAIKPVFVGLSLITFPIGVVVGELFLLIVFFGLFTGVSLIFRLVGFDPLARRFDPAAETYWTPKAQAENARQYMKQY